MLPPGICCVPALGHGSQRGSAGPFRLLFPLTQYRLGGTREVRVPPTGGLGAGEGLRGVGASRPFGAPHLVAQAARALSRAR